MIRRPIVRSSSLPRVAAPGPVAAGRVLLALLLLAGLALGGCATGLRTDLPRPPPSHAAPPQSDGGFAWLASRVAGGGDLSAFHLLDTSEDGLRWRLALIDTARHTLDLQYYLWQGHDSGLLVLKRVMDAANRGVRVRLLIDDIDTLDVEETLAVIGGHPRVEVRLFNPFHRRTMLGRLIDAVERLERLNYRMHNKLMIADNQATIIGGRNVGDEYFGLSRRYNFRDLDVMGFGRVARQSSRAFDRFWNSEWVVPIAALGLETSRAARRAFRTEIGQRIRETPAMSRFPPDPQDWRPALEEIAPRLHVGSARVPSDTPSGDLIARRSAQAVRELLRSAREEVLIVNAYVIPDQSLIAELGRLSAEGVRVRLLTNSLASQDVPGVSSHYKPWRRPLIRAGVELFEKRPDAAIKHPVIDTPPTRSDVSGLHAKAIVIDRRRVYIGSMNLDPRSQNLNSENGVIVDSPSLARELAAIILRDSAPDNAWQLRLTDDGSLRWVAGEEVHDDEPAATLWQRLQDVVFSLLPADLY